MAGWTAFFSLSADPLPYSPEPPASDEKTENYELPTTTTKRQFVYRILARNGEAVCNSNSW